LKDNPIQFAVVREDPLIEAQVIEQYGSSHLLMVCSGGCSVLSLKSMYPKLHIGAFDFNQHQIHLTQLKNESLKDKSNFDSLFNIETASPEGLNQCGNFETLFKGFREFIFNFIIDYAQLREMLCDTKAIPKLKDLLIGHRYWPVAFNLFFHDSFLEVMFGPEAIQHAPQGSYPKYFKRMFEQALNRDDARHNHFLHHIFLGHYLKEKGSLPYYLAHPTQVEDIDYIHGTLKDVSKLGEYDFIQLSNIMDWMDETSNAEIGRLISEKTTSGCVVLIRQLNNTQHILEYFPDFKLDVTLSDKLFLQDRSIFYSSILCLVRS
tara:strand:- start:12657 stop:13616 length:960 start_codon:yes stop_codon:yes gene_type:complete